MGLDCLVDSIADLDSFDEPAPKSAKSAGKPAATANLADDDSEVDEWDEI